MKTYHGSCHCGLVRFTVNTTLDRVVSIQLFDLLEKGCSTIEYRRRIFS